MPSAKELNCDHCESVFKKRADRIGEVNFCSNECRKAWSKEQRESQRGRGCEVCGTFFVPRSSQLKSGGGRFCSAGCSKGMHSGVKRSEATKQRMSAAQKNCEKRVLKGADNPAWKGGRFLGDGYWWLNIDGVKILEHRHVMEQYLGRKLSSDEIVHHINHDKQDNRLENLQVMSRAEHLNEHRSGYDIPVKQGNDIGTSKLTEEQVLEIRNSTLSNVELSRIYGVTPTSIGYIKKRKSWKHV